MDNSGHVAVRPRFYPDDQPLQPGLVQQMSAPVQPANNMTQPQMQMPMMHPQSVNVVPVQAETSKGLFTSVYENKIIVLIIVIIIIIIALVAYVIYRKEDPEPPRPRARRQGAPPPAQVRGDNIADGPKAGGANDERVNDDQAEAEQEPERVEAEAAPAQSPEELRKLLARGRAAAAKTTAVPVPEPSTVPPAETYDDSKSEDEILALMIDSDTKETEPEPVEDEDNTTGVDTTETPTPVEPPKATTEVTPVVDVPTTMKLDPALCSVLVKGRQCRNKPKTEGKCGHHQKTA